MFDKNTYIKEIFQQFGLKDPTPAEIGMFSQTSLNGGIASSAIANYVNTKNAQMKAEADNPLKQFMEEEKVRRADFESKANGLYQQLQETISAAPKLFGNLTPEQINQYIAPITQAARDGSANLEGDFARRNIAGSSIEANALADAHRKYQENLLQTGLGLGMQTQQAEATGIQNRLNQLFGASGQSTNLLGSSASQLTADQQNNLQSITQLPLFLNAMGAQQKALLDDYNSKNKTSLSGAIQGGIAGASAGKVFGPWGAAIGGAGGAVAGSGALN